MRPIGVAFVLLLAAGCTATPSATVRPTSAVPTDFTALSPSPSTRATNIARPTSSPCPSGKLDGRLERQGGELVAVNGAAVVRLNLPPGQYRFRESGGLLVIEDLAGEVVAREGDVVTLIGGAVGEEGAWLVCGGIAVRGPAEESPPPRPEPTASAVPTESDGPTPSDCPAALAQGFLIEDDGELFVREHGGSLYPLIWQPWEHRVERDPSSGRLIVVSPEGEVEAYAGDYVRLGGGETTRNGTFTVCGEFEVIPPATMFPEPGGSVMCVFLAVRENDAAEIPLTLEWSIYYGPAVAYVVTVQGANGGKPIRADATDPETAIAMGLERRGVLQIEQVLARTRNGRTIDLTDAVTADLGTITLDTSRQDYFSGSCPG